MQNAASVLIGLTIVVAVALLGYWFWVPDVGALATWEEFKMLPSMECEIGNTSVQGLSGTMYIMDGKLRADYKVESDGATASFHTIIDTDATTYTWADGIAFAEKTKLDLSDGSTEGNLFKISRCKRTWRIPTELFVVPALSFTERAI